MKPSPAKRLSNPLLLVVDDDPDLRCLLREELDTEGYAVDTAATGQEALLRLQERKIDLVVLDWSLPDLCGIEVCRRLRESGIDTAVLMLTAHDAVEERVAALDAGADDYLTKPFAIRELLARVRARLRRPGSISDPRSGTLLAYADLKVNTSSRHVQRGDRPIQLSVREYDLLLELICHPDQVCTRQELLEAVWGKTFYGDGNVLDVYIRYLRRKLERPGEAKLIQTVRGVGYLLKEEVTLAEAGNQS